MPIPSMTTTVAKARLLAQLRQNLEKHSEIVAEARKNYVELARKQIEARLKLLEEGKIVNLYFDLDPPLDYSETYKTVIEMLEWSEDELIKLSSQDFRNMVMDEWSWASSFYGSNKRFSAQACAIADQKGY